MYQILGTNKWLWPFPVFCGSGKPLGDGIYWATNVKEDEGFSSQKKGETLNSRGSPIKSGDGSANSKYGASIIGGQTGPNVNQF